MSAICNHRASSSFRVRRACLTWAALLVKWIQCPFRPPSGLSKEPDTTRAPRVRTAFTVEQVSTLESSFQHRRYLGPLERRRLAREMRLSEVQVRLGAQAGDGARLAWWPGVAPALILFPHR